MCCGFFNPNRALVTGVLHSTYLCSRMGPIMPLLTMMAYDGMFIGSAKNGILITNALAMAINSEWNKYMVYLDFPKFLIHSFEFLYGSSRLCANDIDAAMPVSAVM